MNRLFRSGLLSLFLCFGLFATAAAQIGEDDSEYDLRIKSILEELDVEYEILEDGDFKIVLPVGDERTQALFINSNTEFYDEMEIREIWSWGYECEGELPQNVANKLLKNSFDQKLGAWQTYVGSETTRAMFAVKMSANANLDSVRSAIIAVITNADAIEENLSGDEDKF